jgi:putative methyltransferase
LDKQLQTTFADYSKTTDLRSVTARGAHAKLLYIDNNVPNLVAIPQSVNITTESAYKDGIFILQDKASCFPALLLDPASTSGDIIDACAAPGNKTTHLAALLASSELHTSEGCRDGKIVACERDTTRSQTLARMVRVAGAEDIVHIKAKQDFMKLNPHAKDFANVTALLLDPSCSGSGIVGRDEVKLDVRLPDAFKAPTPLNKGKKRKRNDANGQTKSTVRPAVDAQDEEIPTQLDKSDPKLQARLSALSDFQLRLLQHAMAFPAARRITYSTCSVYNEENEHVVTKALLSDVALARGWSILKRQNQIEGLKEWKKRGNVDAVVETGIDAGSTSAVLDVNTISDACIRCEKNSNDGTMGFFVAGFVRNVEAPQNGAQFPQQGSKIARTNETGEEEPNDTSDDIEDEWNGFSDEES